MNAHLATEFVAATKSPLVRSVAAALPDLRKTVMQHPELEEDLWFSFYSGKKQPAAGEARDLVSRPLTAAQIDHVLDREKRPRVLIDLVEANTLTEEQLNTLLASKGCVASVTEALLAAPHQQLPRTWLRDAGRKAGGTVLLEWILSASPQELDDTELAQLLRTYSDWGPKWEAKRLLGLLHKRPHLLADAIASGHPQMLTALAGSRLITDPALQRAVAELDAPESCLQDQAWVDAHTFTWLALVWNPVTSMEVIDALDPLLHRQDVKPDGWDAATMRKRSKPAPVTAGFDQVTDPAQLSWLVHRTISKPRPEDLDVLLVNPHLGVGEAITLLDGVLDGGHLAAQVFTDQVVCEHLLALHARFAESRPHFLDDLDRARSGWTNLQRMGTVVPDTRWVPADKVLPEEAVEAAHDHPVASVRYHTASCRYLEKHIAATRTAWLFTLGELDRFNGTLGDLVTVANAVALTAE